MVADTQNVKNVKKLTKRQQLFVEWLATSKYERIPLTQGELAGDLGVNECTLSRWKNLPGFEDQVIATARGFISDRLPELFAALTREAEKGSFQHLKLAFEMCGEHEDSSSVDVTTKGESLNERHTDKARADAMVSVLDAFRTDLLRPDSGGNGSMAPEEQAASGGPVPSS